MKPLFALLVLCVLTSVPAVAKAQADPVNMRSGVDSVTAPPGVTSTAQFFTVPAGQRFVLTDFLTSYQSSIDVLGIVDNTNTLRWDPEAANSRESISLQTGLVFEPGHSVGVQVRPIGPSPESVRFFWSGYLALTTTSSVPPGNGQQLGFSLSPNPARQAVTLRFELTRSAEVNLGIYDAQGRRVRSVARGRLGAGTYVKTWDGSTEAGTLAPSGVYFARLESSEAKSVRRLMRIR